MTSATSVTSNGNKAPVVLSVQPRSDFVETPAIHDHTERVLGFLNAGFPVHFRGPAGSGKTTLAMHVAARLGRPVMLITGDEEFTTSDLIGTQSGYRYRKVVDQFIHTVLKYEEDASHQWVEHRLTTACRQGFTLVYDEFTRARPEANNVLLGVLEEQLLILPSTSRDDAYIRVHPEFRAIFTSNPREYAGVHNAQDALIDRLVTFDVDYPEEETEIAITVAQSGLGARDAGRSVAIVRALRALAADGQTLTVRTSIVIARVSALQGLRPSAKNQRFVQICLDVLAAKIAVPEMSAEQRREQRTMLEELIERYCA